MLRKLSVFVVISLSGIVHAQTTYNAGINSQILTPDPVSADATTRATAVGADAEAGNRSTATGFSSQAVDRSVSIGVTSNATTASVAIGNDASATDRSLAIGSAAGSTDRSIAFGVNSAADSASVAIGNQSSATSSSVALGVGATASGSNSVAIGSGSTASRTNTFSVGSTGSERTVSNVAPGVLATDAANMGQLREVEREMSKGIASAIALSSVMTPSAPGKLTLSIGGGFFNGESAAGLNMAYAVPSWASKRGVLGLGLATTSSSVSGTTGKIFAGLEF